jgi:hypothetical protein
MLFFTGRFWAFKSTICILKPGTRPKGGSPQDKLGTHPQGGGPKDKSKIPVGPAKFGSGERGGDRQKNETPTDEDTSLHPFKTHPMSNPVGVI